jgi:transposase-like protein
VVVCFASSKGAEIPVEKTTKSSVVLPVENVCPRCNAAQEERNHYWLARQKRWKCYSCRKQFSVKVGTIFEDSPLGLDIWLIALWMLCNCRNGVSSYEIARATGIAQKSAWFVLQRLRFVLKEIKPVMMGATGTPVEMDESSL